MKYGGVLPRAGVVQPWAVCVRCELVYKDEVPIMGPVPCPHCASAVYRDLTEEQGRKLINGSLKIEDLRS